MLRRALLDGYVLSIVGVVLVGVIEDLRLTSTETGLVGAASLIGIFFGATVFGSLTDRMGRERMYALDLSVLVVACLFSAFVTESWQLVVLRFVLGLAVGADYPIATSLLTEFTPTNKRGAMIGMTAVAWALGAVLAFVVGWVLIELSGGYHLWRWMLASGAGLGLLVVLARRGIPESPRWLLSKGRVTQARDIVRQVYGQDLDVERFQSSDASVTQTQWGALRVIFRGGYLRRTVMCGVLYLAQITPQYALYTFGPVILMSFGLVGSSLDLLGSMVISALFAVGALPALRWIETVGRRPLCVVPFAIMAVPFLTLWLFPDGPAWFVIVAFCV